MKTETALVFDLGTSSLKAALFTAEGERKAFVRLPYVNEARPDFFGRTVQTVLQTAASAVERLCAGGGFSVSAVVAGGNGPSWVALDSSGEVLGVPFSRLNESEGDAKIRSRYLRLLCAFRRACPELTAKAALFLPFSDYLPFFLTGKAAAALSCVGVRFLYWDEEACRESGCAPEKFPDFILSGEFLGSVTKKAAEFLGIASGVPVYAGAPDYVLGLIGSGSMKSGAVFNRTGTSEALNAVMSDSDKNAVPFWDGLATDSVFLPETGARFGEWFARYFDVPACSSANESGRVAIMSTAAVVNALVRGEKAALPSGAFETGQRLLNEFENAFSAAVAALRLRGRVIDEAIVGGSQAEAVEWIARKGAAAGVRLQAPLFAACELNGAAVLAAAAGKRSAVARLSAEFSGRRQ